MNKCPLTLTTYHGQVIQYEWVPGPGWAAKWFHTQEAIPMSDDLLAVIEDAEVRRKMKEEPSDER